jgi:hypothetical protein
MRFRASFALECFSSAPAITLLIILLCSHDNACKWPLFSQKLLHANQNIHIKGKNIPNIIKEDFYRLVSAHIFLALALNCAHFLKLRLRYRSPSPITIVGAIAHAQYFSFALICALALALNIWKKNLAFFCIKKPILQE